MLGLGNNIFKSSTSQGSLVSNRVSFIGLLNETYGADAEAAYSVRKLSSSATVAMTIRRESDDEELAIGFVNGNINEAAIEAHCTGTTCKVVQWNDQSGNDNHATQDSEGSQPTIYTGGVLVKENGRVAVDFDGSDDSINTSILTALTHPFTVSSVATVDASAVNDDQDRVLFSSPDSTWRAVIFMQNNYTPDEFQAAAGTLVQTNVAVNSNQNLHTVVYKNSSSEYFLQGQSISTGHFGSRTLSGYSLGSNAGTAHFFKGTAQEFIIYDSNKSTVRTDIESNIGDYFTQNTPLLDTYSGAAAAYSLRKLKSDYTGPAISVRNASNVDLDIGFNVFGELDTVSLQAHTGSGDGFVGQWYDQSGSGNHAIQDNEGIQPKIVSSGAVIVDGNGKATISINETYFQTSAAVFSLADDFELFVVLNATPDGGIAGLWVGNPTSYNSGYVGLTHDTNNSSVVNGGWSNVSYRKNSNSITSPTRKILYNNWITASTVLIGASGENLSDTNQDETLRLMAYSTASVTGNLSEYVIYASDQSNFRTGIETNINTFYNIYS